MNKEQVYNILSKRAAQQFYAPVQQSKQSDPIKQFLRRVLGPSVMDYKNGADILRLHLQERRKKLQKLLNSIMPLRKPVPRAANSDHVKQACLQGLMKVAQSGDNSAWVLMPEDNAQSLEDKVEALDPQRQIDKYFALWQIPVKNSQVSPGATDGKPSSGEVTKTTALNKPLNKAQGLAKKLDQAKTPKKPVTPDPWSRWGGKLIGGGLGGLGLYGIMSIFTNSPILRALAFLFGAGAGGYMGHTYDAYKASRVPSSKVPGNKPTT